MSCDRGAPSDHRQLTALVEQGRLVVDTRPFLLDDVSAAHREGLEGHVTGKLVLVPATT